MKLKINVKKFSRKQNQIAQVIYDYPDNMVTVKDLLIETVKIMVSRYNRKLEQGEALTVLTQKEIEDTSVSGKISFGISYGEKKPDLEKSIRTALECFEDGLVVVFADGKQLEKLDEALNIKENSEITFIRMTLLAGRMW